MKFAKFCQALSNRAGSSKTFLVAVTLIAIWAVTGPYFHYNDTWQLIINTSTTIITFLMVFLIQNTQNRDNDILHLKLDELIRATKEAQNATLSLDELGSRDLRKLREEYSDLGQTARLGDITPEAPNVAPHETTLAVQVPVANPGTKPE
ncbi:low affinity iron permease family protein [Pseudomonas fluorescens]|uniref:low affinity iron permease family protein n=1 Tax=Pseudomonas fluorescens TaxID=294 RepID=UPI001BEAA3BC|nr:low affinity iron permease family protein [Pseudomonas fluorescens]MBT2372741.1 low affinity iron permease family protein [Pseudomonas fluorescens]